MVLSRRFGALSALLVSSVACCSSEESGPPEVRELLINVPSISAGDPVTFTAVVADPDGLDTIVSGKLTSMDGAGFYGAFALIGGGTFQLVTSWDLINKVEPIEFTGTEAVRVFWADFVDLDDNHAYASVELKFTCPEPTSACDGVCLDVEEADDHCGKCGNACVTPSSCMAGLCVWP